MVTTSTITATTKRFTDKDIHLSKLDAHNEWPFKRSHDPNNNNPLTNLALASLLTLFGYFTTSRSVHDSEEKSLAQFPKQSVPICVPPMSREAQSSNPHPSPRESVWSEKPEV